MIYTGHEGKRQRTAAGLTLVVHALLAGVPYTRLSAWENGYGRVTEAERERLERILENIERLKRMFPLAIDLRNAESLASAISALEAGNLRRFEPPAAKHDLPADLPPSAIPVQF